MLLLLLMKKKSCAWPKLKNNVKKFIEKRIKPNTEEFFFIKQEYWETNLTVKLYHNLNN